MSIKKITQLEITRSKPTIAELALRKRTPIYVIFENVRSRYNVGAMFRTSDAALVRKIFLVGATPRPPHKLIDKSALGATDVVAWEHVSSCNEVIAELKSQGVFVVALELTHSSVRYDKMDYNFPVCLVVGNEADGISQEVLDMCDAAIDIPMLGRANSLNVATAYGIALFEILMKYKSKHD
jgi:tRNA G18 (ribose-2'-O)-methylase SpoU